jgi:hypothetical protein
MGSSESQCCSIASAGKENMKIQESTDSARKAGRKERRMALKEVASESVSMSIPELRTFSAFVKEHYSSAGDAFDEMFKPEYNRLDNEFGAVFKRQRVDRDVFERSCALAGFTGRAGLVFDLLKDTDDYLTRACFKFRLGTSNLSPGLSKAPKGTASKSTDSADSVPSIQQTSKTAVSGEPSKKTDAVRRMDSVSTTDTSSPPKDSPRKSRRSEDGANVSPPQSPRKSRKTGGGVLGPPPASESPRKSSKDDPDEVWGWGVHDVSERPPFSISEVRQESPKAPKLRRGRSVTKTR